VLNKGHRTAVLNKEPNREPEIQEVQMSREATQATLFDALKAILLPFGDALVVVKDEPDEYYLDAHRPPRPNAQPFFASAKIGKRYVSFHLMPVYVYPELLEGMSADLQKRMQGKSCFNFTQPNAALFAELEELTMRAFATYQEAGYV
jgi:hypothetical protein